MKKRKISAIAQRRLPMIGAIILLGAALAAAGIVGISYFKKTAVQLVVATPKTREVQIASESALPIALTVKAMTSSPLMVRTTVDGHEAHTKSLEVQHNETKKLQYTIETSKLSEGTHVVHIVVASKNQPTHTIASHQFTLNKDSILPAIQNVTVIAKTSASVSLKDTTVSIFDTNPTAASFALHFSEPGMLSIASTSGIDLTWDTEATTSPTVTLGAAQKPFTTTYTFTDRGGLVVSAPFTYFYDNIPPVITLTSTTEMTNKWSMTYSAQFTVSESIKSSTIRFKGKEYPTHTTMGKYAATLTLEFGANTFDITVTDMNNNTTTKTFTVNMTRDSNPVQFGGSKSSFRPCTEEQRKSCEQKLGWDFSTKDCGKFEQYKACLKEVCDSTTSWNICP